MTKKITIIGAGTMGNGIAHAFAQNKFKVQIIDVNQNKLDSALNTISKNLDRMISKGKITDVNKNNTLSNISTSTSINKISNKTDLVIEAATENIDLKINIFKELDKILLKFQKKRKKDIKNGEFHLDESIYDKLNSIKVSSNRVEKIINYCSDWVIHTHKDFARMPNDNEWERFLRSPLDGKIGLSFALQWRFNFGHVFR